tara:strand:+ start:85 stop:780 length:696 start_codon:yes stop_codon:yes gene_type:complete
MKNYPKTRAAWGTRPPRHELEDFFNANWKSREVADAYGVKLSTVNTWKQYYKLSKPRNSTPPPFSNQNLGIIVGEEFRPLVLRLKPNIVTDSYEVSQYGNVIGPRGRKLRWANMNGYPSVALSLPKDIFPDFVGVSNTNPDSTGLKCTTQHKSLHVHRAVANTFLPRPVPEHFKEIWHTLTGEQQGWIQRVYVVDHINGDKTNPHVSNLQYLTTWQNSKHVKERKVDERAL